MFPQESLRVAALHLHDPSVADGAAALAAKHPDLGALLFDRVAGIGLARTRGKHLVATAARKETHEEELIQKHGVFPMAPLLAALALAAAYAFVARFVVLGPLVPLINGLGLAALIVWAVRSMKDK